jgi:hypothetical protein
MRTTAPEHWYGNHLFRDLRYRDKRQLGAATDDVTSVANLEYKLVKAASAEAIDTESEANAVSGADLAMDWTANALTKAVTVSRRAPPTTSPFS